MTHRRIAWIRARAGLGAAACAAALAAGGGIAQADTTVETLSAWDHTGQAPFFSPLGLNSLGQTITVPAGETSLRSFTIPLYEVDDPPTLTMRAEVFAWNGATAEGPALWESAPTVLQHGGVNPATCTSPGGCLDEVTFDTGGIPVTPGQRYVVFLTLTRDVSSGFVGWGWVPDAYPGGEFVATVAPMTYSDLTTMMWPFVDPTLDLAFSVRFGPPDAARRPPFVDGLSSSGGPAEGGQMIEIRGENFSDDARVLFCDEPAARATVDRYDHITAVTPPHAPGGCDVRVVTGVGISPIVDADAYTFAAPAEAAVPASSGATGGTAGTTSAEPKSKPKAKPKKRRRHTRRS